MRTLLLEDVWHLAPGTAVNVFSQLSGGPSHNPRFDEQWLKSHSITKQGLPNLKGPGKGVYFRQVQGYIFANPRQHDILGRLVTELCRSVLIDWNKEGGLQAVKLGTKLCTRLSIQVTLMDTKTEGYRLSLDQ